MTNEYCIVNVMTHIHTVYIDYIRLPPQLMYH